MKRIMIPLNVYLSMGGLFINLKLKDILIKSIHHPTYIELNDIETCDVWYNKTKETIETYLIDVYVKVALEKEYTI